MTSEPVDVCLVADLWEPAFSGAALRFKRYLPGLADLGIRVNVITGTPVASHGDEVQSAPEWASACVGSFLPTFRDGLATVDRIRLPDGPSFRRDRLFDRAIAVHVLRTGPAVCHFLNLSPTRSMILPRLHRAGVASVFTGTLLAQLSSNPLRRLVQRERLRLPVSRVGHVVASSEVMREFFRSLGVRRPISVIPNGVDTRRFRPPRSINEKRSLRAHLALRPDSEIVIFVGSIIPRKGVDLLLAAFAGIVAARPRAELIVIGPPPNASDPGVGSWTRRIEDLCEATGQPDRIHFLGVRSEIDSYLRAADLLIFPSRREGMGNVVLEAMASGLPSILTPYIGLPAELGREGHEYVLADHDAEAIAGEALALLSGTGGGETIGRNAREWVVRGHAVEKSLEAYARLYEDLAGANPDHRAALT